eukprot:2310647-Rhodomonas_salina.1
MRQQGGSGVRVSAYWTVLSRYQERFEQKQISLGHYDSRCAAYCGRREKLRELLGEAEAEEVL